MRPQGARRLRTFFIVEFVAVLASVVVAYLTHWRMPISPWIAIPLGTALWACGFIYTQHLRKDLKQAAERSERPARRRGYPLVEARAAMHLGVALGFRSWPTLIVAAACIAVNLGMAVSMHRKLRSRFGGGRLPHRRPRT